MRVLHLVKTSTGATWAWRQVRELAALGIDVHVALPPGGDMVERYRQIPAPPHLLPVDLPVSRPHQIPAVLRGIRALVADLAPDLIHMHGPGTALSARLALGRTHPTPRILQVPGPLHLEHSALRAAELATAGPRDYWLASCEYTRRLYRSAGIPAHRLGMSYYGTDLEVYRMRGRTGSLRRQLGVGPETRLIGMVAYFYAPKRLLGQRRGLKGHEDLIDAVALCLEGGHDVLAVFVGGPWGGAKRYERHVRAYGRSRCGERAVFLGYRADVPDLYADFDVAVHPSHSENVGAAVELLLDVPTIATTVGGFPELVRPGETGWLVPPRAPGALHDALLRVLGDLTHARRLASQGRKLAANLFDVRLTARAAQTYYEHVLAQTAPHSHAQPPQAPPSHRGGFT